MKANPFLAAGLLAAAAAVGIAQEPQYFEEPPAKPKFSLKWDFLARYDRVDHWRGYEEIGRAIPSIRDASAKPSSSSWSARPSMAHRPAELSAVETRLEWPCGMNARSRCAWGSSGALLGTTGS